MGAFWFSHWGFCGLMECNGPILVVLLRDLPCTCRPRIVVSGVRILFVYWAMRAHPPLFFCAHFIMQHLYYYCCSCHDVLVNVGLGRIKSYGK